MQEKQPSGFESYKKNAAAPGVMSMLQQIINDAKAMEVEKRPISFRQSVKIRETPGFVVWGVWGAISIVNLKEEWPKSSIESFCLISD